MKTIDNIELAFTKEHQTPPLEYQPPKIQRLEPIDIANGYIEVNESSNGVIS